MFGWVSLMAVRRPPPRAFGGFLLALALVGCSASASWTTVQVAPTYRPPRSITLSVSESAEGSETTTLEMALVDAFAELNIHAIPLDDASGTPTLRVVIEKCNPGSDTARRLLSVVSLSGVGEGEVVVNVEARSENGEPAIEGRARSWVDDNADKSLRAVADLIARTVANGSEGPTHPSPPHSGYP